MLYSSFGLLAIVIHAIINVEVMFQKSKANANMLVRRSYKAFLWSVMLYYFVDVLWGFLYEAKIIPLVYADTLLYFLSLVITLLLWIRYICVFLNRSSIPSKVLIGTGWFIFLTQIILLIINLFKPIFFGFDEAKEYVPGFARYITLTMQVVLFAVTAIYTLIIAGRFEGKQRLRYRAIGISGIIMTIFILLQTSFPLLPFYAIGCLLATCVTHTFVVADERLERSRELGSVKQLAYKDALTHVKNKTAFLEMKEDLNVQIQNGEIEELGIVVLDINDLKVINDTRGHEAGDLYIQEACSIICKKFTHSPVYRIGGDEFVVILRGTDYADREKLFETLDLQMEKNLGTGHIVMAAGMSEFQKRRDYGFDSVFKRADYKMYERKKELKKAN